MCGYICMFGVIFFVCLLLFLFPYRKVPRVGMNESANLYCYVQVMKRLTAGGAVKLRVLIKNRG